MPNVIVHVARTVHTPEGSAAAGMVFWQPDPSAPPTVMGFISSKPLIGAYFGPHIFAGTPFEHAAVIEASIEIEKNETFARATVRVAGLVIQTELSAFGPSRLVNRSPSLMAPFEQQGLEASAGKARLWIDSKEISIIVPPLGMSGGPAAVWSPCGLYAR